MSHQTNLESQDIYLCAFLVSQGAKLEGTKRTPDGRVHFLLERVKGMDELIQVYWSNSPISVVPAQLYASLKYLKSLIHSHP